MHLAGTYGIRLKNKNKIALICALATEKEARAFLLKQVKNFSGVNGNLLEHLDGILDIIKEISRTKSLFKFYLIIIL